jgi:hypothetical protein
MRGSAPGERRGGRQRGVKNRRTLALAQAQAETVEKIALALGPAGFDGDALAFLQALYRDTTQAVETRLHAARVAVAYEKPKVDPVFEGVLSGERARVRGKVSTKFPRNFPPPARERD